MENKKYGCSHYDRGCMLLCPECDEYFWCRHCHNDKYEDHLDPKKSHRLEREKVITIKCGECEKEQDISNECIECGLNFGNYYCEKCRFYDNVCKGQFHCDKCGICRVGGKENYFHCDRCNACLSIKMKGKHKCINETLKMNCPVCLDYLMDSTESSNILQCGHSIHKKCQEQLLKSGQTKCPLCNQSMVDMKSQWDNLDYIINMTEMPDIYKDWEVKILCSDCNKESTNIYHIFGIKCKECEGYNTRRVGNEETPSESSIED